MTTKEQMTRTLLALDSASRPPRWRYKSYCKSRTWHRLWTWHCQ